MVLDEDGGDAPRADLAHDLDELQYIGMRQSRRGFVEDQQLGLARQGTRDLQKALRAVGQVLGFGSCIARQSDQFQQGERIGLRLFLLGISQAQQHQRQRFFIRARAGDHDVFECAQFGKKLQVLESARDSRPWQL